MATKVKGSKTIRVDQEVYNTIQSRARGFETVAQTLHRILIEEKNNGD